MIQQRPGLSGVDHEPGDDGIKNDCSVDITWRHSFGRRQPSGISCIRSCVIFIWQIKFPDVSPNNGGYELCPEN